jgi:hypothetical protein
MDNQEIDAIADAVVQKITGQPVKVPDLLREAFKTMNFGPWAEFHQAIGWTAASMIYVTYRISDNGGMIITWMDINRAVIWRQELL